MSKMVSYAEAALPQQVILLQLRLKPFCAGHYLILERYHSPFINGGAITKDDVVFLALVCSLSYEEFLTFIDQEDFNEAIVQWGEKVGDFTFNEVIPTIRQYLDAAITVPKYWVEGDNEGEESGAHWIQNLLLVATGKLGYSMTEARNAPLTQLLYDSLKYAQDNGSIRLMTEDEIEMTGD